MPGLKTLLRKGKGFTMRNHSTPSRVAKIKKTITSVNKIVEKLEPSYIADGNVRWYSHSGEQYGRSLKI